ncbi:MAG TPA: histidinol-phosphate transaminase [Polyangiaceae bacterium]|nr:histidinol-phosphate transaminase [Polyangiaceae bacterium]
MNAQSPYVRSVIQSMAGYLPGEQPRDRSYIKLNTNENPYPPSPEVLSALTHAVSGDLRLYPDPIARELRSKAADVYGVSPECIIAGNGSDDLLTMLFRASVDAGQESSVAYPTPTYTLYDTLAAIQGATPKTVPFAADFSLPEGELLAKGARLNIICNPNSPSGTLTPLSTIERFAAGTRGLVVVDEAYIDFAGGAGGAASPSALSLLGRCPNLVVLRTFSKSFSLAGMRIGLGFASAEIIGELNKVKDSYNLDRLSLVAARAALGDYAWMQANAAKVCAARETLVAELRSLGFVVLPSQANFVFARSTSRDAGELYRALREEGVLVRYFATDALKDGLRITVGTPDDTRALIAALSKIARA